MKYTGSSVIIKKEFSDSWKLVIYLRKGVIANQH